jgi:hypothetical protein
LLFTAVVGCGPRPNSGEDPELTRLGTVEVTARLKEIPGDFPSNDLYDYAYILKYEVLEVHRGAEVGGEIAVAHYNPLKPRSEAQDDFSGTVGGNLRNFRAGDVHRMALEYPLDNHYMGALVDKYFGENRQDTDLPLIYWAVWTNRVVGK